MEKIQFQDVVPHVFAQRKDFHSDIWNTKLTFEKEHLYLIEANSGMGKSTFCSYVTGYRHDYSGQIAFDDRDLRTLRTRNWTDIRQRHISLLYQELRLFPELTSWENVEIKNQLTHFKTRQEISTWFERLGIADKMDAKVGLMSFGQQQRVALIRALVQPFDFLLADEPISHLDDENARVMGDIMMEEAGRQGAGVIVTSIGKHMNLDYQKTLHL